MIKQQCQQHIGDTFVKQLIHTTSIFSSSLTNRGTITCNRTKYHQTKYTKSHPVETEAATIILEIKYLYIQQDIWTGHILPKEHLSIGLLHLKSARQQRNFNTNNQVWITMAKMNEGNTLATTSLVTCKSFSRTISIESSIASFWQNYMLVMFKKKS